MPDKMTKADVKAFEALCALPVGVSFEVVPPGTDEHGTYPWQVRVYDESKQTLYHDGKTFATAAHRALEAAK